MTDDEKVIAVTARLSGEFYVGCRVRGLVERKWTGTVVKLLSDDTVKVHWDHAHDKDAEAYEATHQLAPL